MYFISYKVFIFTGNTTMCGCPIEGSKRLLACALKFNRKKSKTSCGWSHCFIVQTFLSSSVDDANFVTNGQF